MKQLLKEYWFCMAMVAALLGFFAFLSGASKKEDARQAVRQVEINTFYVKHNCHPEGYVATRYEPMRTYRCDTGLYVVSDMK